MDEERKKYTEEETLARAIRLSNLIGECTMDTRVQLLVGVRYLNDDDDKMSVDIVHARVFEMTADSIKLGVTRTTKNGVETFFCWFHRPCFFVERLDKHDNRLDVQIKRGYQLADYQLNWLAKNSEWSTYEPAIAFTEDGE